MAQNCGNRTWLAGTGLLIFADKPTGNVMVRYSAMARVSEAPPEISRGAPHTLLAYYYELQ